MRTYYRGFDLDISALSFCWLGLFLVGSVLILVVRVFGWPRSLVPEVWRGRTEEELQLWFDGKPMPEHERPGITRRANHHG